MKRLLQLLSVPLLMALAWVLYGEYLAAAQPKVEISHVEALAVSGEKNLPFYELMSPLPALAEGKIVPKLEYKKGPPQRFIERITLVLQGDPHAQERIIYHGRRTREDLRGLELFSKEPGREARYLETALLLSQNKEIKLPAWKTFLLRPFLLKEASTWLSGINRVQIMEQAENPAFLFEGASQSGGRALSTALFVRRNSFYRVDYLAEAGFQTINPEENFRKSFLIEKRAEALDYLAKNLSQVRMGEGAPTDLNNTSWPILLLAANLSVDPSSLEAYFHFAGLSSLLYRNLTASTDAQTLDILRNNVLSAEFYARDVSPDARQTAEIERLARLLTRNFE